jgi:hypothetical protein
MILKILKAMENIKYKIQIAMLGAALLIVSSCRDEDAVRMPDIAKGALPILTNVGDGFINLLDIDATNINFNVDLQEYGNVQSADLLAMYTDFSTGQRHTVTIRQLQEWPINVTLSVDEVIGNFPNAVVTKESLDLGDNFEFFLRLNMTDGSVYDRYSPDLRGNTNRVYLSFSVACPSDLAGNYRIDVNTSVSNMYNLTTMNVQIREISPGYYQISDITTNLFGFAIGYRFRDICNQIIPDVGSVDFPTQVLLQDVGQSMVDDGTGAITFDLVYSASSCCGLAGGRLRFVATPLN